ncbi:MAG: helix-turn-helix domain-containing protein [Actinobacteria bacterium]|nr:helix-turn-helix domain-containing protein [Actinomycetota bacterium]
MIDPHEVVAARRVLGRQLAKYRQAAGLNQHQLAPYTHYGRSTIANVEVGRQNVPRRFWERADAVLDAGGALTAKYDELASLVQRQRREIAQASVARREAPHDDSGVLSGLLGHSLATVDQGRQATAALHEEVVNTTVTAGADRLLQLFLQLDAEVGGDDLYEPMTRHVGRLARAVDASPRPATLHSLGQLSQMTGWLALDGNRHGAARRNFTTAVYVAHETDDGSLAASALAYLSLQATYRDHPKRAQALAATAVQAAAKAPTPLVRTMLETRLARAHAKLGNRPESLAALGEAQEAYGRAGAADEPLWISYVDEIEVNAQAGACYLDLGLHTQAGAALARAIALLKARRPERVRDHVHYLSRLAKCRLLAGEVEHACQTGMEALDLALTIGPSRVVERIGEFDAALASVNTNAARDFRERFAVFARSR